LGAKRIKTVKKLQNKPVLPPDTTFERARKWADKNRGIVIGASVAVLFALVSIWGYSAHAHSKQARARSDYAVLASRFPGEGKGTRADWEKLIPDLQQFIAGYKDSPPALEARVELAKAFFETGRYADAIKTGQEALELAPAGQGLRPLILYQLGYAYESAGKLDEAVNEWNSLKQLGARDLEREADWNLGRIFESRKDFTKAAEMYQLAAQTPGDYPSASLIDQRIARVKTVGP
jgi:tetratricopeptide (TPR) repeat protein